MENSGIYFFETEATGGKVPKPVEFCTKQTRHEHLKLKSTNYLLGLIDALCKRLETLEKNIDKTNKES